MAMQVHEIYSQEELQKRAEAELFAKLASREGIDLSRLDDSQIAQLYEATFGKQAEFPPPSDKKEEKDNAEHEKKETPEEEKKEEEAKKEAAAREHQMKLAAAQEDANAFRLGERMAEGYISRLQKEAAAMEQSASQQLQETNKEAAMPENLAKALGKVRGAAGAVASKGKEVAGKAVEVAKNHPKAAAGAGAAAAAGTGFAAGRMSKKKEGSALDALAIEAAIKIAHDAGGYDLEEVADRVAAVHTLGLQESTKLASTVEDQTRVRALEYLEAAGYEVTWDQPSQ